MFAHNRVQPVVSHQLRRMIIVAVLAVSFLAGLGATVNHAGAMTIDFDRGPGALETKRCSDVQVTYFNDVEDLATQTTLSGVLTYNNRVLWDVQTWYGTGCQGYFGDIDTWGR